MRLDKLLDCRQLNLELEPWFDNAEGFRITLPCGRVMEVQMRELLMDARVGLDVSSQRPSLDAVLSAISALYLLIDNE